uniref:Uncharacterized protein n=1 Tax=Ascaris lumbricoides TaxID=6252 RepID=A0A0M3IAS9_ASCLU
MNGDNTQSTNDEEKAMADKVWVTLATSARAQERRRETARVRGERRGSGHSAIKCRCKYENIP